MSSISVLQQTFKIIYPSCFNCDNQLIVSSSIESLSNIELLQNLKNARNYAAEQGVRLKHVDLAYHPAQHNTCLSKYKVFMADNCLNNEMDEDLWGIDTYEVI